MQLAARQDIAGDDALCDQRLHGVLDEPAQRAFGTGAAARDLYCLGWTPAERTPGSDWRETPFLLSMCRDKDKN